MQKFKVTFLPDNLTVEVEQDKTILAAALSAALNLFDDTVTRHALERLFAGFARELSADTAAIAADAVARELALSAAR